MKLNELDEKGFIQEVLGTRATTARPDLFDDCVVVDLGPLTGRPDAPFLVYSMDQPSFVRQPDPSIDPHRFYGRWVAGATCNDVIAMGARCMGFSIALSAPGDMDVEDVTSFVEGICDVLDHCGATYEGGNFDEGPLTTVGCAWGIVARQGLVRRSGARPGDAIVVTGELGLGWLEYQVRKHDLFDRVRAEHQAAFLRYKHMPVGAASAIASVAERGWFTSGMDLSDGLVEFLHTIVRMSGLGCIVDADSLPVSAATRDNLELLVEIEPSLAKALDRSPTFVALEPGYDSPLRHAFTIGREVVVEAQAVFAAHGASLQVIGEVTEDSEVLLRNAGQLTAIPPFWDDQLRQGSVFEAWVDFLKDLA